MMRFWRCLRWLLEGILGGFWAHLGGQVGAKLAQKSITMESKMTCRKEVEINTGDDLFGEIVSGPGTPWEGDKGGGKNRSMD